MIDICPRCSKNPVRVAPDGARLICKTCVDERTRQNRIEFFDSCKDRVLASVGIPREFWEADITNCSHLLGFVGNSVLLTGKRGVGKTYAGIALVLAFMTEVGTCPAKFVTAADLLLEIRGTYNKEGNELHVIEKYTSKAKILVLDDLGAEKSTDWSIATLGVIIDHRYREKLLTITTTNLTLPELSEVLGDRIASRLVGMSNVVQMKGRDRRCV